MTPTTGDIISAVLGETFAVARFLRLVCLPLLLRSRRKQYRSHTMHHACAGIEETGTASETQGEEKTRVGQLEARVWREEERVGGNTQCFALLPFFGFFLPGFLLYSRAHAVVPLGCVTLARCLRSRAHNQASRENSPRSGLGERRQPPGSSQSAWPPRVR